MITPPSSRPVSRQPTRQPEVSMPRPCGRRLGSAILFFVCFVLKAGGDGVEQFFLVGNIHDII